MADSYQPSAPVTHHQYAAQWNEHRYWRKTWIALLIVYVPGIILLDLVADKFFGDSANAIGIATLVWLFTCIVAARRFANFKCPRCGERFFLPKSNSLLNGSNLFAKYCWNCDLEKWEGE